MTKREKQRRIREEIRKEKVSQRDTTVWPRKREAVTGRGKCEDDKEKKEKERGVMGKREEQLARS